MDKEPEITVEEIAKMVHNAMDDMKSDLTDRANAKFWQALEILHPDKEYDGHDHKIIDDALVSYGEAISFQTVMITLTALDKLGTVDIQKS